MKPCFVIGCDPCNGRVAVVSVHTEEHEAEAQIVRLKDAGVNRSCRVYEVWTKTDGRIPRLGDDLDVIIDGDRFAVLAPRWDSATGQVAPGSKR